MDTIELTAGTIDYQDTGGEGPVLVFVGGLIMDETLWEPVVDRLAPDHRCVVPVLPLGGQRRAMAADADLSLLGIADMAAEFMERLDLRNVTLVSVDWGGAQVTAIRHPERVAGQVLMSQEAYDNLPPGLPGRFAALAGVIPGGVWQCAQALRFGPLWRLPFTFGWMAKRPISREMRASWTTGIRTSKAVRGDLLRYIRSTDRAELERIERGGFPTFDRPTLILWGSEEKVMPPEHARALAALIPGAELVMVDDTYVLMPLDQPERVATEIATFVAALAPSVTDVP